MNGVPIKSAMVLAAGLGKRMKPLTDKVPKPLIEIAGTPLLDRGLNMLDRAGVQHVVVNVHHLADQVIDHLAERQSPVIDISDERDGLLDSAGGIIKALPKLGREPFFVINADTFWIDSGPPNLQGLSLAWDGEAMDILLMLARIDQSTGHHGGGDFRLAADGRLSRAPGKPDALIYAGAAIVSPAVFDGAQVLPHSLNRYFDRAIAAGRLYGWPMAGHWITVGTPDAIAPAEALVNRASGK